MSERTKLRDNLKAAADRGCSGYVRQASDLPAILADLSGGVPILITGTVDAEGRMVDVTISMNFLLDMDEEEQGDPMTCADLGHADDECNGQDH